MLKRGFPVFNLGEGGGLRMPDGMGSDGISDKLFPQNLLTIGRKIPMISSILGDSYGGPTWLAVSSDFVSQVKGTSMAVAGPRMLEMATGEEISPEELGGWEVHAKVTGQIDHVSESEEEAIEAMKDFFRYMPLNAEQEPPRKATKDDPDRRLDEVVDLVPTRRTRAYDMKKLIKLIMDDGEFFELKPLFGQSLLTGLAHLNGQVVGVIANQPMKFAGSSGPEECDKATDFICLCDSFHIPLVFLHDIPGFRVSGSAEKKKVPSKIMQWNQPWPGQLYLTISCDSKKHRSSLWQYVRTDHGSRLCCSLAECRNKFYRSGSGSQCSLWQKTEGGRGPGSRKRKTSCCLGI